MKPFPWAQAMQFGFGVLRLSSEQFWALTPRELASAIRARRGDAPAALDRGALEALMRSYPDEVTDGR